MRKVTDLKPSTAVELFFFNAVHKKARARAEYIGCIENQYMMFRWPKSKDSRDASSLRSGVKVMARALVDDFHMDYIVFSAAVQAKITYKEPILVLDYPQEVQTQKLRTQPRIKVELMAEVKVPQMNLDLIALLTDFSLSGCKCECLPSDGSNHDFAELEENLLEKELTINAQFDPVSQTETTLKAVVKNVNAKEKLHLGLKFEKNANQNLQSIFTKLLLDMQGISLTELEQE
ncbi:hypothetical protein C2869_17020 [Saccharobesus litoralis]|uniref:PilZ domain-containing protein n=1 Tax=Saccharobesus litoralis TaxID=2172099 RepID=A0A2S0VV29_9ALTE|nr:hypothetical protein [Saccharobesus litoralis]AWB68022.1 hypothetical protein C2869_17020 [Saccharobesus litoralis]